jgi:putative transposase
VRRVLDVAVAGFYSFLQRPETWCAVIDDVRLAHVRFAFAESGETYGAPRVHQDLPAAGLPTRIKRVARLMPAEGLVARRPARGRVVPTDSTHGEPITPNRLARECDVHGVALTQVWVGDITYIHNREGVPYLSAVLDLGSRCGVGWAMRESMKVDLVTSALRMARDDRQPALGGSSIRIAALNTRLPRTSSELEVYAMLARMSGKGNCYDNVVSESSFATLEFELIMKHDWHTRAEARRAIFLFIETWYKRNRRHSMRATSDPFCTKRSCSSPRRPYHVRVHYFLGKSRV